MLIEGLVWARQSARGMGTAQAPEVFPILYISELAQIG